MNPLLAAQKNEDEWLEYEVNSLFSNYKDYLHVEDSEDLWKKEDFDEYGAIEEDIFQPDIGSNCQSTFLSLKDPLMATTQHPSSSAHTVQYSSIAPSNNTTLTSRATISFQSNASATSTPTFSA